ncbi:putative transporter small subunit [Alkanindiges sp. WGS2144]
MNATLLTIYVLFWPMVATTLLIILCYSLYQDIQEAKRTGEDLV